VQKNLLKFSAHVPVSDEQDKILGAVYLPCDQLRAKKSLHAAATNCQLAKKYATDCPFRHNYRARAREAFCLLVNNVKHGWILADMFLLHFLRKQFSKRKLLVIRHLEARGVEPLSSKRSTQTSTCLSGGKV
jgi:hypothetical protein